MNVQFWNRSFQSVLQPDVECTVERYSKAAIGGPKQAIIRAEGADLDLWELVEYLRCPVKIYSKYGDAVWWGYVHEVQITARALGAEHKPRVFMRTSLDSMFNRIAVAYTLIEIGSDAMGGERETTDWADHEDSQDNYGVKELLWSKDNASQMHAEGARNTRLKNEKFPISSVSTTKDKESQATLVCRGWWNTLDWRYYSNPLSTAMDTAEQVEYIIQERGQFFSGIDRTVDSGIEISQYRDGDGSALFEAVQSLEMGTENYRRMLANVTEHRRVEIYEEPVKPLNPYLLQADGALHDPTDNPLRNETCPVGIWVRLKDVVPPSLDTTKLADPSIHFVEEMEYIVDEDRLQFLARGQLDPWAYPVVKNG